MEIFTKSKGIMLKLKLDSLNIYNDKRHFVNSLTKNSIDLKYKLHTFWIFLMSKNCATNLNTFCYKFYFIENKNSKS